MPVHYMLLLLLLLGGLLTGRNETLDCSTALQVIAKQLSGRSDPLLPVFSHACMRIQRFRCHNE